jgi:ELWxxDGT repeat protein
MRRSLAPYFARLGMLFSRWRSWSSRGSRLCSRRTAGTLRGSHRRLPAVGRSVEQLEYRLALSVTPAEPTLIADINKLPVSVPVIEAADFTAVGTTVFFTAFDQESGRELWKTDGTSAGTARVADIASGADSSTPTSLVAFNGSLYFTADDGVHGRELWKSDGTAAGTVMVKDVSALAGGLDAYNDYSAFVDDPKGRPAKMVVANGVLFFVGNADDTGHELWKTNGTEAGTTLVADINTAGSSYPYELTALGDTVFFAADNNVEGTELWKSDGTESGTKRVLDINTIIHVDPDTQVESTMGSFPSWLTAVGTTLYFVGDDGINGPELWKTDGTKAGTVLVKDINAVVDPLASDPSDPSVVVTFGSSPAWLTAVGTTLYFTADDGVNGRELWKSTGTATGTTLVKDINTAVDSSDPDNPFALGSAPQWLTAVGTTLYFSADDGVKGRELWKSTGTASGTTLVKDINPNVDDSDPDYPVPRGSDPRYLTNVNGKLYFSADGGADSSETDVELWKSDGTASGTVAAANLNESGLYDDSTFGYAYGSSPTGLSAVGGTLYFSATTPANYMFDPNGDSYFASLHLTNTATGATADVGTIPDDTITQDAVYIDSYMSLYYGEPVAFKGAVYFTATNGTSGHELWKTDGTAAGTVLLKDILSGAEGSYPSSFTVVGNTLFFVAEGPAGNELWKTDGTASGTVQVKDIASGQSGSNPYELTAVGNTLYFAATNGTSGYELWKTDGTAAGTVLVKNIRADVADQDGLGSASYLSSSSPLSFTVIGSTLYFSADDGVHGRELWKTDGTAAGTTMVADIDDTVDPDSGPSSGLEGSYGDMTVLNGKPFFLGYDPTHGRELWTSDGTAAGTQILADIAPGADSSDIQLGAIFNGSLYFSAYGSGGHEIWKTDGTPQGTQVFLAGVNASQFTVAGDTLYFVAPAYDGETFTGFELWFSDGTPEGTLPLTIVDPVSQLPLTSFYDLMSLYGDLYFMASPQAADESSRVWSFWHLDDPADTGSLVIDGNTFSRINGVTAGLGQIVFAADDGQTGLELRKVDALGDKPTVTIGIDRTSFKKGDTATVSFTLSESSTGFAANDVTVVSGSLSNFAGTGTSYTAKFTPAASFVGTGTISVASGGFLGALGLANSASSLADELSIDTADAIVTIASNKAALKAGEQATITFTLNKPSTTFTLEDVTATGGILSNFTGSDSSYSATFTPTASSTTPGGVSVAASKYTDLSGNPNVAGSLPIAIKIDTVVPTIAITSNKTTLKIGETATLTFKLSESLTGFSLAGLTVGGGTLSKLAGSGTTYTAMFSPATASTTDGTVSLDAGAGTDAAGNPSAASSLATAIKIDTLAPLVTITSSKESLKVGETATILFTLSENSTDFAATDVKTTGGTLSNFLGTGSLYTALFTPTANSTAAGVVTVASGTFKDAVGNPNAPGALSPAIKIDTVAPTMKITSAKASLKIGETTTVTFTTSEPTNDFSLDDISSTGGILSGFTGSGSTYSALFTPAAPSTTAGAISVAAGKFSDTAGNPNTVGILPSSIKIDTAPPTLTIASSVAALAKGKTAKLTFTLSEPSTTFASSDVAVTGGTLSGFSGKGAAYSATFTPTAGFNGAGTVSVAAGTFSDLAGNPSDSGAALSPTLKIDSVVPTIAITSDKASLLAGETALITFSLSEDSTDFTLADVVVAGGALSPLTGSGSSYSATFTPKAGSTTPGTIAVAATKFTDAVGNPNTAGSLAAAIKINTVQPTLKITSSKSALKAAETATITFAFSENVTDFTLEDIASTGGLLTAFTGSGKSYSAIFAPNTASTTDGAVSVAASAARNTVGNGNPAASLAKAIKIDTVLPTILITSDLSTLTMGTKAKITFSLSEASTTFAASDVTVTNGTLSAFTGTGTTYIATFTPKTGFKGSGTISVTAGKFTDKAGNNNIAGELASALTIDA